MIAASAEKGEMEVMADLSLRVNFSVHFCERQNVQQNCNSKVNSAVVCIKAAESKFVDS